MIRISFEQLEKREMLSSISFAENVNQILVTTEGLQDTFTPVIEAKRSINENIEIVTVEEIEEKYNGIEVGDTPDKIREFVRHASTQGIDYVTIAGDYELIPARKIYNATGNYTTNVLSDAYYANVDGVYNGDGDNKWGESTDGENGGDVDLQADVFLGRIPVSTPEEARQYIKNWVSYITTPHDNAKRIGFVGDKLDSTTYGKTYLEPIRDSLSEDWSTDTFYKEDDNWSKSDIIEYISNESPHIINGMQHSDWCDDVGKMREADVNAIDTDSPYIIYSNGCNAGKFSADDSMAENYLTSDAVVAILNTSYGFYYPGNYPGGYNYHHNINFMNELLNEKVEQIGDAFYQAKENLAYRVGSTGSNRWGYFSISYFGDPALHLNKGVADMPKIEGDINGDGKVDLDDASLIIANWGKESDTADINGDGIVDMEDASIVIADWDVTNESYVSEEESVLAVTPVRTIFTQAQEDKDNKKDNEEETLIKPMDIQIVDYLAVS